MRCSKSIVVVEMNECVLKTWQCPQLDDSFTRIGILWTADFSLVLRGPFISIFGIRSCSTLRYLVAPKPDCCRSTACQVGQARLGDACTGV